MTKFFIKHFLFFFLIVNLVNAQKQDVDSLYKLANKNAGLHTYAADTASYGLYFMIGEQLINNNTDSALYFYKKAQQKINPLKDNFRQSRVLNRIGFCWYRKNNYDSALAYFEASLHLSKLSFAGNYNDIALVYIKKGEQTKANEYAIKGLTEYDTQKNQKGIAESIYIKATVETELGNYKEAMSLFEKSLIISEKINDPLGIAAALAGASTLYNYNGNFTKAFDNLFKALSLYEANNQQYGIINTYASIGALYIKLSEFDKAKSYYSKALNLSKMINNTAGIAANYGNVGTVFDEKNELDSALYYYNKALTMETEFGNKIGMARQLSNIGGIYMVKEKYEDAISKLLLAVDLNKNISNISYLKTNYMLLADVYLREKKYALSETYIQQSIALCNELRSYHGLKNAYAVAIELYKATGDYKKALNAYEKFTAARDSVSSKNNEKASVQKEMQYEFGRKIMADSIKASEEKKVNIIRNKQEQTVRYSLYAGLLFILAFAGFIYNRYRASQKQQLIIKQQKHLVDEKQKEILDSIKYAQRIQKAHLPTEKFIMRNMEKLKNI